MSKHNPFDLDVDDIAWCPGCGNYAILNCIKQALSESDINPMNLVMVSGIGQAAKLPQYIHAHYFNGLHGRALPPATAIKAVNPDLTVIAESGDGDMYGEGGNHFIHTIRRNPDITNIVHDNMIYGLTKGQASPTSMKKMKTTLQIHGVILEPFNPLAVAIALDASFVARAYAGDKKETIDILKKAISHKGFALVDLLQPCVTFNHINTYDWFKDHTYYLDESYDTSDRLQAFQTSLSQDRLALGVFYQHEKPLFHEQQPIYQSNHTPRIHRKTNVEEFKNLLETFT